MRRVRLALGLLTLAAAVLAVFLAPVAADGPWKGQIVDKETGQPIEDVVVLAYWIQLTGTIAGWGGGRYEGAEETVTGPDGRFVIPAHSTATAEASRRIAGPELVIYKPGFGRWRFQGSDSWPKDVVLAQQEGRRAWKRFAGEGVVIELPPLKSKEERLRMLDTVTWDPGIPADKTSRLRDLKRQERGYLGLH